jgi:hypothetical protein
MAEQLVFRRLLPHDPAAPAPARTRGDEPVVDGASGVQAARRRLCGVQRLAAPAGAVQQKVGVVAARLPAERGGAGGGVQEGGAVQASIRQGEWCQRRRPAAPQAPSALPSKGRSKRPNPRQPPC